MIMLGHVLPWRIITAKRNAAGLTGAQMYPLPSLFHTFFACIRFWLLYRGDLRNVVARLVVIHDLNFEVVYPNIK
jgi:hypothetical protein